MCLNLALPANSVKLRHCCLGEKIIIGNQITKNIPFRGEVKRAIVFISGQLYITSWEPAFNKSSFCQAWKTMTILANICIHQLVVLLKNDYHVQFWPWMEEKSVSSGVISSNASSVTLSMYMAGYTFEIVFLKSNHKGTCKTILYS